MKNVLGLGLAALPLIVMLLVLSACAHLGDVPPVYGCQDLEEFNCPNSDGAPDDAR